MRQLTRRGGLGLLLAAAAAGPALAGPKRETQAYGPNSFNQLDVYPRDGLSGAPVLLFVHGGAWAFGDRGGVNALPDYATRNGFLLMSMDYRLTPRVDAGGEAEDVAAAFAWAKANAARYGGDPDHIVLVGHSSGAHLVVLVGVDPTYLAAHQLAPKDIAGVIALDGAGYNAAQEMRWFAGRPMGEQFDKAFGPRADALSPTLLASASVAMPPFLILYILSRPDSPPQARALAAAIRQAGGTVAIRCTADRTHAEINQNFGLPGSADGDMGAAFIKTGALPADLVIDNRGEVVQGE
jgi:arylformamidase